MIVEYEQFLFSLNFMIFFSYAPCILGIVESGFIGFFSLVSLAMYTIILWTSIKVEKSMSVKIVLNTLSIHNLLQCKSCMPLWCNPSFFIIPNISHISNIRNISNIANIIHISNIPNISNINNISNTSKICNMINISNMIV